MLIHFSLHCIAWFKRQIQTHARVSSGTVLGTKVRVDSQNAQDVAELMSLVSMPCVCMKYLSWDVGVSSCDVLSFIHWGLLTWTQRSALLGLLPRHLWQHRPQQLQLKSRMSSSPPPRKEQRREMPGRKNQWQRCRKGGRWETSCWKRRQTQGAWHWRSKPFPTQTSCARKCNPFRTTLRSLVALCNFLFFVI